MFRRLTYLWKGADMDFFNPFNVVNIFIIILGFIS